LKARPLDIAGYGEEDEEIAATASEASTLPLGAGIRDDGGDA
jgi:hypothetical protein